MIIGKSIAVSSRVCVVGGGISGLMIANAALRKNATVTLYEKSNRLGGLIETKMTPYGIAETALHSTLSTPEWRELLSELRLEEVQLNPKSKNRFIVREGKLKRFPLTVKETIVTLKRILSKQQPLKSDATLAQFVKTYLGEPALNWLVRPGVRGIFAAKPEELDSEFVFPDFIPEMESSLFSHLRGLRKKKKENRALKKGGMVSVKGGMGEIVRALEKKLKASNKLTLHLNAEALEVAELEKKFDHVIFCVPVQALPSVFRNHAAQKEIESSVSQVKSAPLVTATVFCKKGFRHKVHGVGLLVPPQEKGSELLGILFNSSSFEGRVSDSNYLSCTALLGGTEKAEAFEWSDEKVKTFLNERFKSLLNLEPESDSIFITRWKQAIPVYDAHLKAACAGLENLAQKYPKFSFFGNYTGQVSFRGLVQASSKS